MTNLKIKPRLLEICNLIEPNSKVVDVGADHALLDIYLNIYKNCECLAIDISENCINRAIENANKYGADINFKVNDGLTGIELNDEIIVTVIATGFEGKEKNSPSHASREETIDVTFDDENEDTVIPAFLRKRNF